MQAHNLLHRFVRSRPHLTVSILIGIAIAVLLPASWQPVRRALMAWNSTTWTYLLAMAWVMLRADPGKVKSIADRQDENAGLILLSLSLAALISITAIVVELRQFSNASGQERIVHVLFAAFTIFGSWFLVGTLFCIHYAHLYYQAPKDKRPLAFPQADIEPDYWDFLYFSFTIAVAAQTSDVVINTRQVRKLVLAQSLLSFFFNLVILGLSVNLGAALINNG
jgi:uncharacterized membrane protein